MKTKKALMLSVRIGFGSALAIFIASAFQLESAVSAGTITLLTLLTTRKQTLRLIANRFWTFATTVLTCLIIMPLIRDELIAFALILIVTVAISEFAHVQNTLSVSALIATHLTITHGFTWPIILNELYLLCIGVVIAWVFNYFHDYAGMKEDLHERLCQTDSDFQQLLTSLANSLSEPCSCQEREELGQKMDQIENHLIFCCQEAKEYEEHLFKNKKIVYTDYFRMRQLQLAILKVLNSRLEGTGSFPESREVVQFMQELAAHSPNKEFPVCQRKKLSEIFTQVKRLPVPQNAQETESRAILYHILYDLDDYLHMKEEFVQGLDDLQQAEFALVSA